jgi:hypothetical protein
MEDVTERHNRNHFLPFTAFGSRLCAPDLDPAAPTNGFQ